MRPSPRAPASDELGHALSIASEPDAGLAPGDLRVPGSSASVARIELTASWSVPGTFEHRVQFYELDAFLFGAILAFFKAGLELGEPFVVLATLPHRLAIRHHLEIAGFDVDRLCADGDLALVDARETMATFMVDGMPDRRRFNEQIGRLIDKARGSDRSRRVRAFGEMVDLAWKDGHVEGTLEIERLWNELATTSSLSLLCGYSLGPFADDAHSAAFRRICDAHEHVTPTEIYPTDGDSETRLREVSLLQQRARALQNEIERRQRLEVELRTALAEREAFEAEICRQNGELARTIRFGELFVKLLGHDLRNPLSAITTAASLIRRRMGADKLAQPATRILNSASRMGRMIDQLLDFTSIRLGEGLRIKPARTDLAQACRAVLDELVSAGQLEAIELKCAGDSVGFWDADRLLHLLSNLMTGPFRETAPPREVTISIGGTDAAWVVLDIHCSGKVAASVLHDLFDPEGAGGPTDSPESLSSGGLALFVAQKIVHAHSGTIDALSSDSDGTRFVVRVPRDTLSAAADGGAQEPRAT